MADTAAPAFPSEDVVRVLPETPGDGPPHGGPGVAHDVPENDLLRMHRVMTLTRALDARGMLLQRQGRLGFYLPSSGEEGLQAGSAWALRDTDWLFPSYRVSGIALWRGAALDKLVANCYGNADDNAKGRQMPVHYSLSEIRWVSISSPLGTQIVQAAGAARAAQIRREDTVVATWFGDGSTSTNDFHCGMNFAGVWKAPCVFFCQNNRWAISTPLSQQCAAPSLADKAIGYGMPGVRVDGNDVLAVAQVTKEAVDRARAGGGPTFIEALTFRMGPHSSSDDPTRYRAPAEVEEWKRRDPIERFRAYLVREGVLRADEVPAIEEECAAEVAASFKRNETVDKPSLGSLFEDVYAEMPEHLREQKEFLEALEGGKVREDTSGAAFPL
jgi:TPP-dependent pyruvate/acetoin dehydrogenase alpha subunit